MRSDGEGCAVLPTEYEYYCYCDSRTKDRCSRESKIQDRLLAKALAHYKDKHPTTLPPTTTSDPKHRCLKGADNLVACSGSSFCHSKIIYNPATLQISNRTGLGCTETIPDETLKESCRKVEPFNTSDPIFECFCTSEVGRACNALDEDRNKARTDKWDKEVGAMMKKVVEEGKIEGTEEPKKKKNKGNEKGAFPIVAVFGSAAGISILFLLVVGGCVAFFFYRRGNLNRQLKKIAQSMMFTSLNDCEPRAVMDHWHCNMTVKVFYPSSVVRNVDFTKLIQEKSTKKVLGEGLLTIRGDNDQSYLAMVAATAVDTKLPGDVQMPWNFVDDEERFIGAQCPLKSYLGEFFLSLVHADVKCVMQLTHRGEVMGDGASTDYLPLGKGSLEQMKVGDATIDVRISAVQDKKSYTYRKLHIKVKSEEAGKDGTYVVDHFHYQDWTEQDIPTERADIFDVVFMVFKASTYVDKRLLVHCRDGIGRTGAFLLVQILLKKAFQKIEFTTESAYELAKSIRFHRYDAIEKPSQIGFALFIMAGIIMKAADATSRESLSFRKFSESLSAEIARDAALRKRAAESRAKKAAKKAAEEAAKEEKGNGGGGGNEVGEKSGESGGKFEGGEKKNEA